jgi:hypothetical protein
MPLMRYFLSIGGALLALLFILDTYLPKPAVPDRANSDLPVIRIHSDRKWPERVVYNTNLPTIIPVPIANTDGVPTRVAIADASAKAQFREAFAQVQPSDINQLHPSGPEKLGPSLPGGKRTWRLGAPTSEIDPHRAWALARQRPGVL